MIEQLLQVISPWIDALWLPIAFFGVHKHQRLWTLAFFVGGMIMLRLQVELVLSTGYVTGFLPILDSSPFRRGLITYSAFYALYIIMAYFSPRSDKHVLMAASISIFFAAMFVSSLIMLL